MRNVFQVPGSTVGTGAFRLDNNFNVFIYYMGNSSSSSSSDRLKCKTVSSSGALITVAFKFVASTAATTTADDTVCVSAYINMNKLTFLRFNLLLLLLILLLMHPMARRIIR